MTPIVLHHGLFGFGELQLGKLRLSYFHKIDRAIAERGHPIIISRVHPTGSIERRASQLKRIILQQMQVQGLHDRVVVVAHSMGGLDARYMIARLGMAERVAALVTISTPHRGSPYADWCLKHLGKRLGGLRLLNSLGLDVQAVSDLTVDRCAAFNDEVADVPGVRYFSVSAARPWNRVPPFLLLSHQIIQQAEGDNDGLVSVTSAQWGEHLGTWPADHLHTVNRRVLPELDHPTGSIVPYYLNVLDRLRAEGLLEPSGVA